MSTAREAYVKKKNGTFLYTWTKENATVFF